VRLPPPPPRAYISRRTARDPSRGREERETAKPDPNSPMPANLATNNDPNGGRTTAALLPGRDKDT